MLPSECAFCDYDAGSNGTTGWPRVSTYYFCDRCKTNADFHISGVREPQTRAHTIGKTKTRLLVFLSNGYKKAKGRPSLTSTKEYSCATLLAAYRKIREDEAGCWGDNDDFFDKVLLHFDRDGNRVAQGGAAADGEVGGGGHAASGSPVPDDDDSCYIHDHGTPGERTFICDRCVRDTELAEPAVPSHSAKQQQKKKKKGKHASAAMVWVKAGASGRTLSIPVAVTTESHGDAKWWKSFASVVDVATRGAQMAFLGRAIRGLMSGQYKKYNAFFDKPMLDILADKQEKEEYSRMFKAASQRMDFGTIKAKLEQGQYSSTAGFQADVRLVFLNAYRFFFPTGSHLKYHHAADALSDAFESFMEDVPEDLPEDFPEDGSGSGAAAASPRGVSACADHFAMAGQSAAVAGGLPHVCTGDGATRNEAKRRTRSDGERIGSGRKRAKTACKLRTTNTAKMPDLLSGGHPNETIQRWTDFSPDEREPFGDEAERAQAAKKTRETVNMHAREDNGEAAEEPSAAGAAQGAQSATTMPIQDLALEVVMQISGGDAKMKEAAGAHRQAERATAAQQFATVTAAMKSLEVHQPSLVENLQEKRVNTCAAAKATADASVAKAVAKLHAAEEQNSGSDSDEEELNDDKELRDARARYIERLGDIVTARREAADTAGVKLVQSDTDFKETRRKRKQALDDQVESARTQKERTIDAIEARYGRLNAEIEDLWKSREGRLPLQSAAPSPPRSEEQTSSTVAADDSNAPSSPGLFAKPAECVLDSDPEVE
jgi:hypothetical protein